ncbi:MFS transporter [Nocardiopsis halotolerans]|uniref:MFS transporter n=1 Tax=Nocardiopsis halotolerans TaxID=124252 RepID=UPI0003702D9A|nr:MFS transporter [Nocardiopsis halotolerans]
MSPFRRARGARPSRAPLGPDFARLWCVSALTNLGDGALIAAGPLLVASLSPSPLAVSAASALQMLPHLLFSLTSGALVDRLPRRGVLAAANLARGVVLALLTAVILSGSASPWPVYAAVFALGVGETLADTAYGSLLPSVVHRDALGRANARLALTFSVNNQLVGPPLGALMFAALWALPFGFDALAYLVSALVVLRIRPTPPPPGTGHGSGARTTLRSDVAQGLAFVWGSPGLRTLCGCILVMNLAGVGAFALWVLYAREHLGLSDTGFGLFVTAGAAGGVLGSQVYGWLEARVGRAFLLRWGLVVEAATYLALTLTTDGLVAGVVMVLFGVHTVVWGTAATTVRQRLTPDRLLGRVGGVYRLADLGGASLGAVAGGLIAEYAGLLVPFWIATAAVGLLAVSAWRPLVTTQRL